MSSSINSNSSSNIFSHPNKKLEEHLLNVGNLSKQIFTDLNFKNHVLFAEISFLIGISHDFAKSTSFFQKHLFEGFKSEKTRHGFLSAVFGYYVIKNFLIEKKFMKNNYFKAISYLVILRHHGNLKSLKGTDKEIGKLKIDFDKLILQIEDLNKQEVNGNLNSLYNFYKKHNIDIFDFLNIYSTLKKEINKDLKELFLSKDISNYLNLLILYSVLLDSDKLDASQIKMIQCKTIPSDIVDKFKQEKFKDKNTLINQIREKSYILCMDKLNSIDIKNKIFSLELPTGCGKTLNSFSFSLKLREKINNDHDFTPRIIYSLPFLSIIDQNEAVIREILQYSNLKGSDILLKHNHMSDMNYITEDENFDDNSSKLLTEGWQSEIIVTTFIQLFYSLISNKNRSLRKFHNIANSIIILDEIQSIPFKFWPIINKILKNLAYNFNSWIILITATQPLIFEENEEIIPLIDNKEEYFEEFDRVVFNFNLEDKLLDDFKEEICKTIDNNPDKDIMVVLNTINSSQELYKYVKEHFSNNFDDEFENDSIGIKTFAEKIDLIYLSTNILPKHRLDRINHIKNSKNRKIVVTTQLIEAGVDISVDIIYRDFAPLDSIIQTAGRCNRNYSKNMGQVNIVNLVNEKNKPYANFVYNSILLQSTKKIIGDITEINESKFNLFSKKYYEILIEDGSQEDSLNLLNILTTLNFSEIPYKFKLLDNNGANKIDIYVNINEDANEIWEKFMEIEEEKNNFKRKNKFLKIKSSFYQYVVSIDIKKFGKALLHNEYLGYVPEDLLNEKYDLETGFISEDEEEPFII
ncbi:MAG: CRISPR-associated helicase Cas3' [Methanobrevibacter sp.]|jgi:CRISPR-associated endonuclease/helicase Cas3|nr:CRISPR-associated helicase Cas3' [Candidatus Methanovirga meridionalis]